jgi:hypothetical protein
MAAMTLPVALHNISYFLQSSSINVLYGCMWVCVGRGPEELDRFLPTFIHKKDDSNSMVSMDSKLKNKTK